MDERTLEVVIKAQNETKAAFAEIMGSLAALQTHTDAARGNSGGNGILGFVSSLAALMPGGTVMGYAILGVIGLSAALAPLGYALLAVTANAIAWTAIATVAVGAIGALTAGIFALGAANAGGLSPSTEMVKAHHALDTAIKEHTEALKELKMAQAGIDIYDLGKGSKAQNIALAKDYVTATTTNLKDAQHDYREPAGGLGGPIANLGSAIDDIQHHFEAASRPFAEHIAMWAMQFLPAIEKAGDAMLRWFGERAPAIFSTLSAIVGNLSGFFTSIFSTIGRVVDYLLSHQAEVDAFWKGFLGFAAAAFSGFMNVMMGIADWFRNNWPAISAAAAVTAKAIGDGFKVWLPAIMNSLRVLGDDLRDVGKNIKDLEPLWIAFGIVVGGVLEGVIGFIDAIVNGLKLIEAGLSAIEGHGGGSGGHTTGGGHAGVTGPNHPSSAPPPTSGGGQLHPL